MQTILVLAGDTKQKCIDALHSHPFAQKLSESFKMAFDDTIKILKKYSHLVLEKQLSFSSVYSDGIISMWIEYK